MEIPRDKGFDNTLALLANGYRFISDRCEQYQSDVFETRLMFQKAICTMGEDAARMFYHPGRFTRKKAMPPTTLLLLQDKGSVQAKDGETHRHRKQMFMSLMTPENIQRLVQITVDQWYEYLKKWQKMEKVVIHSEVQEILCRAVCKWAGISLTEPEIRKRTSEFAAMIDGAGTAGPRNWKGLLLRMKNEQWAREVIMAVRNKKYGSVDGSAVDVIANHRDQEGELLDIKVAAVELINLLRTTVAVARYITFSSLALHEHPESRKKLIEQPGYDELFMQEVRRFYPFFPLIAGRVLNEFEWKGYHFTKDLWVLLDIYGTNHDSRIWEEPEKFLPERHLNQENNTFKMIPQGGGNHMSTHRCPGEWITIELMKTFTELLVSSLKYDVPEQNLNIDMSRMPAIPESRFVISNVYQV